MGKWTKVAIYSSERLDSPFRIGYKITNPEWRSDMNNRKKVFLTPVVLATFFIQGCWTTEAWQRVDGVGDFTVALLSTPLTLVMDVFTLGGALSGDEAAAAWTTAASAYGSSSTTYSNGYYSGSSYEDSSSDSSDRCMMYGDVEKCYYEHTCYNGSEKRIGGGYFANSRIAKEDGDAFEWALGQDGKIGNNWSCSTSRK